MDQSEAKELLPTSKENGYGSTNACVWNGNIANDRAAVERSTNDRADIELPLTNTSSDDHRTKRRKIAQVSLLLLAQFCALSGYSMISPFFPTEAKSKGLTETEIGVIFALFSGVVFITSPIYGAFVSV